jgi:hypothetical protein
MMRPIRRVHGPAPGKPCEWCGQRLAINEQGVTLGYSGPGGFAERHWHRECEQAHLASRNAAYAPGNGERPALAASVEPAAHSDPTDGLDGARGVAFAIAALCFGAVLVYGFWRIIG